MPFFPTAAIAAVDGTSPGRHALHAAVELCLATGSSLHLVHIKLTSAMLRGRPMTPAQRERADAESHQLLNVERTAAIEAGLEPAGTHLRYGQDIEQGLVGAQQELGADLLIIAAGAQGRLAQRLLGPGPRSSARAVRRSPASVLVVRAPAD